MNALTAAALALPAALDPAVAARAASHARRRRVAGLAIETPRLVRFNDLLARLGRAPVQADQLATAARQLDAVTGDGLPPCIALRFECARLLVAMVGDAAWTPAPDGAGEARLVAEYVQDTDDLIPDALPRFGRLDDAIVVDSAWSRIGAEAARYRAFARARQLEAWLRGCAVAALDFDRARWEAESRGTRASARLRQARYLGTAPPLLRVQ
ncbi:DUF1232 domain-containing protein [Coralloluteibacterium stylophorae]|uniref:DUF1232 domain-containing protein n=1 Tax=Coralloluteibacterium stylophorae TaxID=1776034 RepID=A0A8J7VSQ4_9GAMM|nr:DUF1232 domain-containing protein [Coralloluteibacterium stylophorae]MBS7456949.1 DUF1232 domain-containing protein [Coralloluteibacterium stylophorae]